MPLARPRYRPPLTDEQRKELRRVRELEAVIYEELRTAERLVAASESGRLCAPPGYAASLPPRLARARATAEQWESEIYHGASARELLTRFVEGEGWVAEPTLDEALAYARERVCAYDKSRNRLTRLAAELACDTARLCAQALGAEPSSLELDEALDEAKRSHREELESGKRHNPRGRIDRACEAIALLCGVSATKVRTATIGE